MDQDEWEKLHDVADAVSESGREKSSGEKVLGVVKWIVAVAVCVGGYYFIQHSSACKDSDMRYDPEYGK